MTEKIARPFSPRRVEDLLWRSFLDHLSALENGYPVRDAASKSHLVGHNDHRHTLLGQSLHDAEHLAHRFGVERRSRLVEQHDIGTHRQRAGDRDTLLLSA